MGTATAFKRVGANAVEQTAAQDPTPLHLQENYLPQNMIGGRYEAHVYLNDIECPCLIDT